MSYEESNKVVDEIVYKRNLQFDLKPYRNKIQNDFMKDAFVYYDKFDEDAQKIKWKRFINSIILELYEYRNSEFHYGKVNRNAELKLKSILPYFMNQIRWTLIETCEKNPSLTLEMLLNRISS